MSRPFKVGDRVAVYAEGVREVGKVVQERTASQAMVVQLEDNMMSPCMTVHPKQLRHLKKRERRRVWINVYRGYLNQVAHPSKQVADKHNAGRDDCIEFIEVRKKK